MELAHAGGVSVPAVFARLAPRHRIGEGFVMARVAGETLPHRILGKPDYAAAEALLAKQCARELARIHALDPGALPIPLPYRSPRELLEREEAKYRRIGAALPAFDWAFGWLFRNIPEPVAPVVLHGDFRMGNLLIGPEGIRAVLDWELAHLGDPAQDLAYLCVPSWRFGHHEKSAGGFDSLPALLDAYSAESGRQIEPSRIAWWLVYGTLWWGMVCLSMGQFWRSGEDRSLERAVIGRRCSEVELDLLLLLDEELGLAGDAGKLDWQPPAEPMFVGDIHGAELLAAIAEWAREAVQAGASGHALFEARVAVNAVGMAQRAASWGNEFAAAEAAGLAAMGLDPAAFCSALRSGHIAPGDGPVWTHLRRRALQRIAIDQPAYAGNRRAIARWCRSG
jgi:aminoglycoside phosphotransferase (APT) family kinase protein